MILDPKPYSAPVVGILGGGQLGRMLALAGYPLGIQFVVLDPAKDAPTQPLSTFLCANYTDSRALSALAAQSDVITFEFENVPSSTLEQLRAERPAFPPARALEIAQDRIFEKNYFKSLGIPTPGYLPVGSAEDLAEAVETLGLPCVLKTRRLGYDGKGQCVLRSIEDLPRAYTQLAQGGAELILEAFVPFTRELSVIGVRGKNAEVVVYPLVENTHAEGILRKTRAPAPGLTAELSATAEAYICKLLHGLDYVGVLALELFEYQGRLLANEMAPRVHNSGHFSIEGSATSQFENHLRAILGLPLGSSAPRGHAIMLNLIGTLPEPQRVLQFPNTHLHLYGKAARMGRKVGHITLCGTDPQELEERASALEQVLDNG